MAPDSQSVMPVLGSSIAGTRPLGFSFSKGGFLRSAMSANELRLHFEEGRLGRGTHKFCVVRDLELLEDYGDLPRVWPRG